MRKQTCEESGQRREYLSELKERHAGGEVSTHRQEVCGGSVVAVHYRALTVGSCFS